MKRNIPPLNSLKSFEAAARHLSFTYAADELCVTQGAISKQIKTLEDFLGKDLFKRIPSGLLLTAEGKQYAKKIISSLDIISEATNVILDSNDGKGVLTINILPSLSTYWLIPYIENFKKENPEVIINVITGDEINIDFDLLSTDVAIRGNNKLFDNLVNIPLIEEKMCLVCSPSFINDDVLEPKDITDYVLLEHTSRPEVWNNWIQTLNLENTAHNTLGFEHFFMLIEAAKKGLGFALIPDFLVDDDLQKGHLINPLGITYKTDFTYYLLYLHNNKNNKTIKGFSTWMQMDLLHKAVN